MVSVPSFILRRLYVKGSLRGTSNGMEFHLLNKLGSGYARRILPIIVDGKEIPLARCEFQVDELSVPFQEVSQDKPFTIAINKTTKVVAEGIKLTSKPHKISMGFEVAGLGVLKFDFTDTPSNG